MQSGLAGRLRCPQRPMRLQRGFAVAILLLGAMSLFSLCLASLMVERLAAIAANRNSSQRDYLSRSAALVTLWYRSHLAEVAAISGPLEMGSLLTAANITPQFGLRSWSSALISDRQVAGHILLLWIPGQSAGSPHWDPRSGHVVDFSGALTEVVSGLSLQQAAFKDTSAYLAQFAERIEHWAASRARQELGEIACNPFRPDPSCQAQGQSLPATDGYMRAKDIAWASFGLDPAPATDAWGGAIEISNDQDCETQSPPYSMVLRSRTPFGQSIRIYAIQKL